MDDRTAGLVIRALRRRKTWRQQDLAERAGVSRATISRAERGWLEQLSLRTVRRIFGALEARILLDPRWRGAGIERLLDQGHAAVVSAVARRLESMGWDVAVEVTYSEFGERGSIDVLATRPSRRAVAVVEVKTDIGSAEAVGRKLDEKVRLTPTIVRERHGWTPSAIGRILVMPDTMRLRRLVGRHEVLGRMFPPGAVRVRAWLHEPRGSLAGSWFLSVSRPRIGSESRAVRGGRIKPL